MNIFQALGLPELHRAPKNKVTQLVKHFDEVVAANKKDKRYGIQLKKDGVCAITIVDSGHVEIFSRTGRKFTNTSVICHHIRRMNLRDGVYFGELCCDLDHISLEMLSGITSPNRTATVTPDHPAHDVLDNMSMYFYDLISIKSFEKGTSDTPFQRRYDNLVERIYGTESNPSLHPAESTNAVSVINLLRIPHEEDIDNCLKAAINNDEEGIVIIDLDADWEAGHKGWRKMKKVRGVDYDLKCIGYEEGTGKYKGLVANLIFQWKGGKTIKCMLGKGWTHQMAAEMFQAIKQHERRAEIPYTASRIAQELTPIGKIYQVYALEESSKGKLRLPKVGEQRHDKSESDV